NADKHNIPKGKIKDHHLLLPNNIRDKINARNNMRKSNPKDPNIAILNKEINILISTHKTNIWKDKLNENWDHKTNSHKLWNLMSNLNNKKPSQQENRTISFNNKPQSAAKGHSNCIQPTIHQHH